MVPIKIDESRFAFSRAAPSLRFCSCVSAPAFLLLLKAMHYIFEPKPSLGPLGVAASVTD